MVFLIQLARFMFVFFKPGKLKSYTDQSGNSWVLDLLGNFILVFFFWCTLHSRSHKTLILNIKNNIEIQRTEEYPPKFYEEFFHALYWWPASNRIVSRLMLKCAMDQLLHSLTLRKMQWKQLWMQTLRSFCCLWKQLQTFSHLILCMLFYSDIYVPDQVSTACLPSVPSGSEDFPTNEFFIFKIHFSMTDGVLEIHLKKLNYLREKAPTNNPSQNKPLKKSPTKNPAQSAEKKLGY